MYARKLNGSTIMFVYGEKTQEEEELNSSQEAADIKTVLHCLHIAKHIEED